MTHLATEGDEVIVILRDVTKLDASLLEVAVTTGLTGTAELQSWDEGVVVVGPTAITLSVDAHWYVSLVAPVDGHYRVIVVATVAGAQRTFAGELQVGPATT